MSLSIHWDEVLKKMLHCEHDSISAQQLIHTIDLTLLDEQATENALNQLKQSALQHHVAALCVYSQHLQTVHNGSDIQLATVINFPQGTESIDVSLNAIEEAKLLGATEIDYVLPYRLYLDGQQKVALAQCQAVSELCKSHGLTLKIILETGAFSELQTIYEVSQQLINTGCDFLKTSTGKIAQGASLPSVFAMLSAIKDGESSCGIKVSGGVKTKTDALNYAALAELLLAKKIDKSWFRLGASSLLNELT